MSAAVPQRKLTRLQKSGGKVTIARKETIIRGEQAVYHCRTRCVRRAFLCGWDSFSQKNFDYRKKWIKERLKFLAHVFNLEPIAFALMSNHLHVLLRTLLRELSDDEVARRWLALYPRSKKVDGSTIPAEFEISAITNNKERVKILRQRLNDVSWFMKSLNEYVARRANKEDECVGRFWEGRFKCQRLDSDAAVLVCAAYIDLNPIRAAAAKTPEESVYTSAWERIQARDARARLASYSNNQIQLSPGEFESLTERSKLDNWLAPFQPAGDLEGFSEITLDQYLSILDWTGRELRSDKRGKIPDSLAPILERLRILPSRWLEATEKYNSQFFRVVADAQTMARVAKETGRRWLRGAKAAARIFDTAAAMPA